MVKICEAVFDPWQALQDYQNSKLIAGAYGATSVFVGTMRDFNQDEAVSAMTLEYYPGMTEKVLMSIVEQARQRWAITDVLVIHRVGDILPNQPIVLVAVWAVHRGDAFDACRMVMEALKTTAPFWKKEQLGLKQSRWVESNSNGYLKPNTNI